MKKHIVALFPNKLYARSAAMSIGKISGIEEISSKISFGEMPFTSFFTLKFLLTGAIFGYITGAVFSIITGYYFEVLSIAGFLAGISFGAVCGAFTDLFLSNKNENTTIIKVTARKENLYHIIKRLKKARAVEIYFTSTNNL